MEFSIARYLVQRDDVGEFSRNYITLNFLEQLLCKIKYDTT